MKYAHEEQSKQGHYGFNEKVVGYVGAGAQSAWRLCMEVIRRKALATDVLCSSQCARD